MLRKKPSFPLRVIDTFWPFLGGGGYVFLAKKGGPKSGLKMSFLGGFRFLREKRPFLTPPDPKNRDFTIFLWGVQNSVAETPNLGKSRCFWKVDFGFFWSKIDQKWPLNAAFSGKMAVFYGGGGVSKNPVFFGLFFLRFDPEKILTKNDLFN
jgi:hypothetical protein